MGRDCPSSGQRRLGFEEYAPIFVGAKSQKPLDGVQWGRHVVIGDKRKIHPKSIKNSMGQRLQEVRKRISNIWAGLLGDFKILSSWLAWSPGDGREVCVGEDPIVGGPHSFIMSSELLFHLHCRGFDSLYHVALAPTRGYVHQGWMSASQLGLVGGMGAE